MQDVMIGRILILTSFPPNLSETYMQIEFFVWPEKQCLIFLCGQSRETVFNLHVYTRTSHALLWKKFNYIFKLKCG
jgi:hypothetical protein